MGGILHSPCPSVRPSEKFVSPFSRLVFIGMIWYLVWSIILWSCTVSPLFRSVEGLLLVCQYFAIYQYQTIEWKFVSPFSQLVFIGMIWYLVLTYILGSCTVSPLFRSVEDLLPVCRYFAIFQYPTLIWKFVSPFSQLVFIGMIWYLVWSFIFRSCTVSPLYR